MAEGKWISYLRVSADHQGKSGLGLEAQRTSVTDFLNGGRRKLIKEFVEVESGKRADRPQLEAALAACRLYGAKLVIAKLDRLSRDAHFLLGLDKADLAGTERDDLGTRFRNDAEHKPLDFRLLAPVSSIHSSK